MRRFIALAMLLVLGLSGCGIEGGAIPPSQQPTGLPAPTQAPTIPAGAQDWTLGVTEEPLDLYPYSYAARTTAPLLELLYPAPLQIISETYTTTGPE